MTGILWQIIYSWNSSSYLELNKNCTQAKKQHLGFRQFSQGRCLVSLSCKRHLMAGIHGLGGVCVRVGDGGREAMAVWLRRTAVLSQTLWWWCSQEFCSLGLESFVICSYVRAHVLVVIYQIIVPTDERCHDVTLRKQHLRWCKTFDLIFMFLVVCYGIQLCWSGNDYWCW